MTLGEILGVISVWLMFGVLMGDRKIPDQSLREFLDEHADSIAVLAIFAFVLLLIYMVLKTTPDNAVMGTWEMIVLVGMSAGSWVTGFYAASLRKRVNKDTNSRKNGPMTDTYVEEGKALMTLLESLVIRVMRDAEDNGELLGPNEINRRAGLFLDQAVRSADRDWIGTGVLSSLEAKGVVERLPRGKRRLVATGNGRT
ncbi:MAG: hypothetical protein OXN21_14535 [Chloroflexota bacterium]|nr:hypothetical protein [Chloroflexota bacterium]